ncbi:MAG: flagellar biosynthetic protein FliO [Bryobacteraceae bacterium]|jgi:flagellar biogenesis protein FliO
MEAFRELLAASAVGLLLGGGLWWLRRQGWVRAAARGGRPRLLHVVERAALSQNHSLHLVRVAGRGLLLAVSPGGCAVLESFAWGTLEEPSGKAAEAGR